MADSNKNCSWDLRSWKVTDWTSNRDLERDNEKWRERERENIDRQAQIQADCYPFQKIARQKLVMKGQGES